MTAIKTEDHQLIREQLGRSLYAVEELTNRWLRHAKRARTDPAEDGMCRGWAQAISLITGQKYSTVVGELGRLLRTMDG